MEIWKDIKGYENLYQVSTYGNIKSYYRNKILKPKIDKDGYCLINLYKNKICKTFKIHRLVAQHFINNPNGYKEINHINEIKSDNHLVNLEWCTHKYNNNYKNKNATTSKPVNQYDLQGNFIRSYKSTLEAKRLTGVNNISGCCLGKLKTSGGFIWRYI